MSEGPNNLYIEVYILGNSDLNLENVEAGSHLSFWWFVNVRQWDVVICYRSQPPGG